LSRRKQALAKSYSVLLCRQCSSYKQPNRKLLFNKPQDS